jgi:hypothetical protein
MPDWLQLFEIARFGRPLVLSAIVYAALWASTRVLHVPSIPTRAVAADRLLVLACGIACVAFIAIATWYGCDRRYYDFAEPTMPAVAWMFEIGKPLYPVTTAAERYAHIYGPMAFIPYGAAIRLFGPDDLIVTKWPGAAAGVVSLVFVFVTLRSRVSTARSIVFTGYSALLLLVFRNAAFWSRPDSLELLCTSIAVWSVARPRPLGWLAVGVTAGILCDLKFSGPLYCLPLFVILLQHSRTRGVALAIETAALIAAVPFIAFQNVSLHGYLSWILLSARNGIVWSTLRLNVEWVLFLMAPLAIAAGLSARQQRSATVSRPVSGALVIAMCSVAILASKPGAGPYHLLPFLPMLALLTALQLDGIPSDDRQVRLLTFTYTAVAAVIALAQQSSFISTLREIDAGGPSADVTRFIDAHAGAVIQIGYSSDERTTFVRPLVVFRSNLYLLDQPAIQEHQLAGVEIPDATKMALRACAVNYWLIPRAGEPFSAVNRYPAMHGRPLFDTSFRRAFFEAYERSARTEYFDVWTCRKRSSEAGR